MSRVILEYLITSVKRYKLSLSPVRALNRDKLRAIFKSTTTMLPVRLYVISRLSSANKIQGCQIMDKIGKFRAIQPALGFFISMRFVTFPSNFRYLSPPSPRYPLRGGRRAGGRQNHTHKSKYNSL